MCRLVAYRGENLLLADVLVKPEDSLIKQSLQAQESTVTTNGDGFGVGWYNPKISQNPAVFLSVLPAWNDENLLHLANIIESPLFFGHVRAASVGGVNKYNCHPFIYNNWMFVHNGYIDNFLSIKRQLRRMLDDDIYNWIRGETDSEHLFALFLQLMKNSKSTNIAEVLKMTFKTIAQLLNQYGTPGISFYNLCITDGSRIVASRYCTDEKTEPDSLHYMKGNYFWSENDYLSKLKSKPKQCVLIASEKLTDFNEYWQTVPVNNLIVVDADYSVQIEPI
jgi:glutamine amidotransferase